MPTEFSFEEATQAEPQSFSFEEASAPEEFSFDEAKSASAPSPSPEDAIADFQKKSSDQMMSPRIATPSQKNLLAMEQERIAGETAPLTAKVASKVASGLEKGMTMPERTIRGALDFLGFYGALDATMGTGSKYQDYNRGWLEYFNKRDKQLTKEDADLGATGFGYDVAEGVARAATELPTQLLGGAAGAARGAAVKGAALTAGAIGGLSQYAQDRGAGKGKTESAIYGGVSGAITGLTTAAFGATGVESIFKNEGVRGVSNRILNVLKQAGLEGAEESVDQFQQDLLERTAREPNKPIRESVREILLAGSVGSLIGGAASSLAELGGVAPETPSVNAQPPKETAPPPENLLEPPVESTPATGVKPITTPKPSEFTPDQAARQAEANRKMQEDFDKAFPKQAEPPTTTPAAPSQAADASTIKTEAKGGYSFGESDIQVSKPSVQRRKRPNGDDITTSVEVRAPIEITRPENWTSIDPDHVSYNVEARGDFESRKAAKKSEPVWRVWNPKLKEFVGTGLTFNDAVALAKSEMVKRNFKQVEEPPPPPTAIATPGPEPIGMGGAVASEFQQSAQTPTSIKNAQVDIERAKRGLPPAIKPIRRDFGTVWDEAMAKIDNDPGYPDRLLTELRDNPRSLTDLEDATLLHRQIDLHNEYGKATRDLAQAFDDGRTDAVANERARANAVRDQLYDLYEIGKKVGTATGRGLAARKMMAYEDFTLAKMELEKRAVANEGAPLTDNQLAEVVRLNKRIEETQKAFDDYVAKTEAANAERAIKDALDEAQRQANKEPVIEPHVKIIADKIKVYFDNRADAALKRLSGKLFTISPQVLADLTDLGVSRILGGAASFTGWSAKMVEAVGERIKPHLQTVWDASQNALNEHIDKVAGAGVEKVKRVVKGSPISEQITATKNAVVERVSTGRRNEVSPLAQKLARLFVEQGIKERDPLIDAVHEVLKEADPEFTRRETMDAISGYGEFRQLSKDEISKQLRDLKGQMQQVAKLEDMQAGKPPLKTGLERRIPSPEESRLIKKVNEAKNQFQIPIDDPNTQLKSSLDTLKTRLKNRTIELSDKLARGDFEKKPRRIIQMDAEANRLSFEAAKAKADWHKALMLDRLSKRSVPAKIFAGIGEVLNTSRAILTSMDLSAVLRQGGFIAFAHPIRAAKSFPAMFKAFRSEAGQHAVDQQILARKNYPIYAQGKLYLSEHGQKLSQMEEAYMSRWADKIPLIAGSQRAYVTFLNKLRADSFDAMANTLARTSELTPVEVNAIANFINVATGRGNLGMKENALVGLNTVFFAPRYVASRFQLLAGQPLYRGTARTRIAVAKEYARYLAGIAIVYALASIDGAEIEEDPRSSNFGKLRYGNTRLDPMSGLLQNTVLLSRLATGEIKPEKGGIMPIRGEKVPFGGSDATDVITRFLRSKLSPAIGTMLNLLTGKDVVGQPVTAASTAENLLIPLAFRDIYDVMIEQGIPKGTALGILSILGMGLQNYEAKKGG